MASIKFHKNIILYLGWSLFFLVLFFRGCASSQPQFATVKIKEITKTLPVDTIVKHEVIKVPKWYKDSKTEKKYLKDLSEAEERIANYQEEIDNMQTEYAWGDSIKKAELYRLATQLKKFESNFEDEHLKLSINGIIAGNEVKEVTPTYTIKEKKIDVPQKNKVLVGGGLGNSLNFDKPIFYGNLGFQNKKGNILRIGYDSEKRIIIGYDFKL
jgi:hypothetical protein